MDSDMSVLFHFSEHYSCVVLSGLLRGLLVPNGHNVSFPYGIPGGRCLADRFDQVAQSLHELNHILHRLFVPATSRFPIPIDRFQFDPAIV